MLFCVVSAKGSTRCNELCAEVDRHMPISEKWRVSGTQTGRADQVRRLSRKPLRGQSRFEYKITLLAFEAACNKDPLRCNELGAVNWIALCALCECTIICLMAHSGTVLFTPTNFPRTGSLRMCLFAGCLWRQSPPLAFLNVHRSLYDNVISLIRTELPLV